MESVKSVKELLNLRNNAGVIEISGYGCHCDLEPNQSPDGCVIDEGRINDCVYAKILSKEGKVRDDCEYWQPIRVLSTQGEEL